MSVLLETTLGDIVIDLFTEERPRTSLNFIKLCKLKMYNFCAVHNVQRNFIIQCGELGVWTPMGHVPLELFLLSMMIYLQIILGYYGGHNMAVQLVINECSSPY